MYIIFNTQYIHIYFVGLNAWPPLLGIECEQILFITSEVIFVALVICSIGYFTILFNVIAELFAFTVFLYNEGLSATLCMLG